MHAVIRNYSGSGAKELLNFLETRKDEIVGLMQSVRGFVSYALVRTAEGGFSVSVFQDKAGADESTTKAKAWIQSNGGSAGASPPTIAEGEVIVHVGAERAG